jgi:aminoglycoside phosphotransferase (APT) family kinase protein
MSVPSAIKPRLTADEIVALVQRGLDAPVPIVSITEHTDGWFNAAHGVRLADGRELVLKVAPASDLSLLRYEVELMRTEIHFFERARAAGVPMPAVHHADPDAGVLLMDSLRGRTLDAVKSDLPRDALLSVRRQIGGLAARITSVTGPLFGYLRRDGRTRSASWRVSFLAMVDDILLDAVELDAALPLPAHEIASLIHRHAALLDAVTTPCLVHFDLWDGNIFVIEDAQGWGVEGVIDGERAFYGDPIAELTTIVSLTPADQADVVIDSMIGRPLSESERTRLHLYATYLGLVVACEPATRGYDPVEYEPTRQFFHRLLAEELTHLQDHAS